MLHVLQPLNKDIFSLLSWHVGALNEYFKKRTKVYCGRGLP